MKSIREENVRVVSWGPEVGAGVRKGPGLNTKTSTSNGIEVRVRGEGDVEFGV